MQFLHHWLITALWVAWYIYWRIAAFNVKPTVRQVATRLQLASTMGLIAALLLLGNFGFRWGILSEPIWPRTDLTFWLGVVIMALGIAFTVWARVTLGRNWSSTITLKQNHELIQTGPYDWVRHPIYTGVLMMVVGTAIAVGEWRALLAAALVLGSLLIKLRIEEKWMTDYFGPGYAAYSKRVAMLIPWLW